MSFFSTIFGTGNHEKDKLLENQPPKDPQDKTADKITAKGMHNTTCTDVCCLVVFIAYLVGLGYVLFHAFTHGDPRRLIHGFDYTGALCGVDENVSDKPYLFWCGGDGPRVDGFPTTLNFADPICVKECPLAQPTTSTTRVPYVHPTAAPVYPSFYCPGEEQVSTKITGTPPEITRTQTIVQAIRQEESYPTKVYMHRYCVPDVSLESSLMQSVMNSTAMSQGSQEVLDALEGIATAWPVMVASAIAAVLLCYVYLFLLRRFARILIYVALAILTVGTLLIGLALLSTSMDLTGNQDKSPIFHRYPHDEAVLYSQIGAGIFLSIFAAFAILLICCSSVIKTALGCVEAACECMFGEFELLIQPLVDAAIRCCCFCCLAYGFLWVLSMGEIEADHDMSVGGTVVAGVSRSVKYTNEERYMVVYYVFGYFWIMELCNSLGQFVISYMVVLWYYTRKGDNDKKKLVVGALIRGYGAAIVHLGTLAAGAFLIATCRMARMILGFIARQAQANGNSALACCAKALMCCVDCFKRFLEYINKNAYIDVAINSSNFMTAAVHSFEFLASNGASIMLLNGACFIFVLAGVGLVGGTTGYASYLFLTNYEPYMSDTSETFIADPQVAAVAAGLIGFVIAVCFMMVFDLTADTLLYCFVWNKKQDPQGVRFYAPSTLSNLVK